MPWKEIRLGDAATFVNGYAFKPKDWSDTGAEIIRIANLTGSNSNFNFFKKELNDKYKVRKGDLLISWSATLGVFEWEREDGWLNQHIFKVIFDKAEFDKTFFKYLIQSVLFRLEREVHGSTMKHITKKRFDAVKIPLPPLKTQQRIAEILDNAAALRDKTAQLLTEYDLLAQSIFLEMFGDVVSNPKKWETQTIEQLVINDKGSIKRGPFGGALKKEIFVEKGYLVYEQYHALNNDFSFERYYISEDDFKRLKGFEIKSGDIIISCSGVYLGKLAIIPENAKKGIINQALLKVSIDETKMRRDFFIFHFTQENFRDKYFGANRGAGIPNFPPMARFKKFPFITPPIKLQNQFADKIALIEQQKALAKQELQQAEDLFNCLLQKAFKGELV